MPLISSSTVVVRRVYSHDVRVAHGRSREIAERVVEGPLPLPAPFAKAPGDLRAPVLVSLDVPSDAEWCSSTSIRVRLGTCMKSPRNGFGRPALKQDGSPSSVLRIASMVSAACETHSVSARLDLATRSRPKWPCSHSHGTDCFERMIPSSAAARAKAIWQSPTATG